MSKLLDKGKKIYWALIITFAALYTAIAFVSTLHAITFFSLANTVGLAILLGAAYEIGQSAVLLSILMSDNKNRLLSWLMMILLTALQITANVYASFKFMDSSGNNDWTYWQRAILFGVEAENAENYKVIISWISGALLPIIALGMTALVADNIKLMREKDKSNDEIENDRLHEIIENEVQKRLAERPMGNSKNNYNDTSFELINDFDKQDINITSDNRNINISENNEELDSSISDIEDMTFHNPSLKKKKEIIKKVYDEIKNNHIDSQMNNETANIQDYISDIINDNASNISKPPINKIRGWHLMSEFVDDDYNVFNKGAFIKNDIEKTPTSKKVEGQA